MTSNDTLWIGADPGGRGNFRIACIKCDGSVYACSVDCADDAINVVREQAKSKPLGVGVEAPLWWSSGHAGDRQADRWLRKKYHLPGGHVQAANSLQGAALVQGTMFVYRMRQLFPGVNVTETHPKALLRALALPDMEAFSTLFPTIVGSKNDHERDAIISAVAACEGFEGRWQHDLSLTCFESEQDPSSYLFIGWRRFIIFGLRNDKIIYKSSCCLRPRWCYVINGSYNSILGILEEDKNGIISMQRPHYGHFIEWNKFFYYN